MILFGEKGVRPARRRHQRNPPRTLRKDARSRGTEIEQSTRRRCGRIELLLRRWIFKGRQTAALRNDSAPITIDRERNDRIRKSFAFVIEIQNRIRERVAKRMMQR